MLQLSHMLNHTTNKAMKKSTLAIVLTLMTCINASALSYEESRTRSWYLTDKMAYELNLSQKQYDKVFEINMDYFLNINYPGDIDGPYWRYRNEDLGYVLFDWQFSRYRDIEYFYRPLIWRSGVCIMTTYDFYDRGFYYFARPAIYGTYRGASWAHRPKHSPYRRMTFSANMGMRDRYQDRGHGYYFRGGQRTDAPPFNGNDYGKRNSFQNRRQEGPRNSGPNFGNNPKQSPNANRNRVQTEGRNYRDMDNNSGRNNNWNKGRNNDRTNNSTRQNPTNNYRVNSSYRNSGSNSSINSGNGSFRPKTESSSSSRTNDRQSPSVGTTPANDNHRSHTNTRIQNSSSNSRNNSSRTAPTQSSSDKVKAPTRTQSPSTPANNTRTRSFGQ